jgi:hypothetical protein
MKEVPSDSQKTNKKIASALDDSLNSTLSYVQEHSGESDAVAVDIVSALIKRWIRLIRYILFDRTNG